MCFHVRHLVVIAEVDGGSASPSTSVAFRHCYYAEINYSSVPRSNRGPPICCPEYEGCREIIILEPFKAFGGNAVVFPSHIGFPSHLSTHSVIIHQSRVWVPVLLCQREHPARSFTAVPCTEWRFSNFLPPR